MDKSENELEDRIDGYRVQALKANARAEEFQKVLEGVLALWDHANAEMMKEMMERCGGLPAVEDPAAIRYLRNVVRRVEAGGEPMFAINSKPKSHAKNYNHSREISAQYAEILFRQHFGLSKNDPRFKDLWESETREHKQYGMVNNVYKWMGSITSYMTEEEVLAAIEEWNNANE